MKKRELFGILLRAAVALALFAAALINYDRLAHLDISALVSFTESIPVICAVVLAVYAVKALVFVLPASVIYVAVGTILPPALAVAVNLTGIFIEVTLTYLLGRFLGKEAVYKLLSKNEKGKMLLEKNPGGKAGVIFGIRAVPAFPIDAISLFYGASGVPYLRYVLMSFLGVSWRVVLFTLLGDAVFAWIPMDKIILAVIVMIPVGVAFYLVKKLIVDRRKKAAAEKGDSEN